VLVLLLLLGLNLLFLLLGGLDVVLLLLALESTKDATALAATNRSALGILLLGLGLVVCGGVGSDRGLLCGWNLAGLLGLLLIGRLGSNSDTSSGSRTGPYESLVVNSRERPGITHRGA